VLVSPREVAQVRTKRSIKRTEITMETDELVSARRIAPSEPSGVCPVCRQKVVMVTPEHAARIAGVSTRMIYAWAESGKLHFTETREGSLLVCPDSLPIATLPTVDVARRPRSS